MERVSKAPGTVLVPLTTEAHNALVATFNQIAAELSAKPGTKRRAELAVFYYAGVQAALIEVGYAAGPRIVAPLMLAGREPQPVKLEG
jgi:hypothetical protein